MPQSYKTVLTFLSEREAVEAGAVISEIPGFEAYPMAVVEQGIGWTLECYDEGALMSDGQSALAFAGIAARSQQVVEVPATDWVAETQRSLPPVKAGRFAVHGSHSRGSSISQWAIEIDAGRAFGTAHHATTQGCLSLIDRLALGARPRSVLDLGTGSGVLAIAAAKAFAHRAATIAADIDPIAIEVARENCRKNGVSAAVRLFIGDGLKPLSAYAFAPFDLVIANILARPLLKLAPRLRLLTERGGVVILSGLLASQAREVLARYRATGFVLIDRRDLEGWATLALRRVT